MRKKVCIGALLLAMAACGGGGDGGGTGSEDVPEVQPPAPQSITLAAGDAKTVHANVGDKLDVHATGAKGYQSRAADGKICKLTASSIENGFELTIGAGTTECIVQYTFSGGATGQVDILVP